MLALLQGVKYMRFFLKKYFRPVVVSGFEPVDVMNSISMIVKQFLEGKFEVEVQYKRAVTREGNIKAQELIEKYFEKAHFSWRGLGEIKDSGWRLKKEFDRYNAEIIFKDILPNRKIDDHKLCICGDILKGKAKPYDAPYLEKLVSQTLLLVAVW